MKERKKVELLEGTAVSYGGYFLIIILSSYYLCACVSFRVHRKVQMWTCSELSPIVFLSLLQLLLATVPSQMMIVFEDSEGLTKEPQQSSKSVDLCCMLAWIYSCMLKVKLAQLLFLLCFLWSWTEHTCSLSEAVHLAVSDPAVDGKEVGVSLRGFHFHLGREPGVLWEQWQTLFVELYQNKLSNGGRAAHSKSRHLQ